MILFKIQKVFCIRKFESCVNTRKKTCDRFEISIALQKDLKKAAYLQVMQPVLALGLLALSFFLF